MTVTCFWLEETGQVRVGLRRYRSGEASCPLPQGYHDAVTMTGTVPLRWQAERPDATHWFAGRDGRHGVPDYQWPAHDDRRWAAACACGEPFRESDEWQEWSEALYLRAGTSEVMTLRDAPDGAMWEAWWMPDAWKGPDGRSLMVKCPGGGEWAIDSRAANCTMPKDTQHRCWVRHGEPPSITVDKNGLTCQAGGGSIISGNYHCFLRDGVFT
jgi:hypothetical protein